MPSFMNQGSRTSLRIFSWVRHLASNPPKASEIVETRNANLIAQGLGGCLSLPRSRWHGTRAVEIINLGQNTGWRTLGFREWLVYVD